MFPFKLLNLSIRCAKREAEKSMIHLQHAETAGDDIILRLQHLDKAFVANKKAFEWLMALLEVK